MVKKYLVRRENCLILGPMTIDEFREGLRKMRFGVQDEVTGHCQPWVILDNEALVKKRYPELAEIVVDELPAAWREMTGHAKQITMKEKRQRDVDHKTKPKNLPRAEARRLQAKRAKRNNMLMFVSGMIAVGAVSAAIWIKNREEPLPPVTEISTLAQATDPTAFLNEMGLRVVPIVSRINKGRDKDGTWLPYLRMYAFYTNGSIENLSLKYLRGSVPPAAPNDCSVDVWKKRWQESGVQVAATTSGKSLGKNLWSKLLAWDPHWVRRHPTKGWYKPKSWFEGCLMSASVAIRAVSTEASESGVAPEITAAVIRRLQAQLEIIQLGRTNVPIDTSNVWGELTCFDQAETQAALETCRQKYADVAVQTHADEYANWQLVRLAMVSSAPVIEPGLQTSLSNAISKLIPEQSITRLDYTLELQFSHELQQAGYKTTGIVERLASQNPDLHLKP